MVPAPNIQTILYATDLGESTQPVFRLAVSQARRYNARLLVLHVVEPLGSTGTAIIANYISGEVAEKINRDGAHELLDVMKKRIGAYCKEDLAAFGLDRTPEIEILVASGNPVEEILDAARKHHAGMIVIGTSTRSFLGSVIMGTTARRVARHSSIPVLLVPNGAR